MRLPRDVRMSPGEEPVFLLRTHPKVLFGAGVRWLLLICLAYACHILIPATLGEGWVYRGAQIITLLLTLHYAIAPIMVWRRKIYIVTTKQIIIREGIMARRSLSTQLSRISDIQVERGVLDRIFGCGTLIVVNAANGEASQTGRVMFSDVPGVLKVEAKLKDMVYHGLEHSPAAR